MEAQQYEARIKALAADLELMAHITSHDLRDPLRQAVINCEEIKKSGNNNALVDEIAASVNEVIARIALLREFSYLANFHNELKPVDCDKVLQEAIKNNNEKIAANKVKLTYGKLPVISGYEPHIVKLFSYLIDNAIKFDGLNINITAEEQGGYFQFSIADDGIGLDRVYRELVFALFQRLTPEIKDGSFGAGLAFCKKIVENHGGKIWYESDGEKGTVFYFTLGKS